MDAGDGWQAITTAFGHGKDSYIQSSDKDAGDFGKHPFIRVKRSDRIEAGAQPQRLPRL
jgi:hypothetical protein